MLIWTEAWSLAAMIRFVAELKSITRAVRITMQHTRYRSEHIVKDVSSKNNHTTCEEYICRRTCLLRSAFSMDLTNLLFGTLLRQQRDRNDVYFIQRTWATKNIFFAISLAVELRIAGNCEIASQKHTKVDCSTHPECLTGRNTWMQTAAKNTTTIV